MAFVGHVNGSTYRKGINITYQSMVDGELVYEYQIKQMLKKSASLRCAGCRSAMRDGREPEFVPPYISGKINFETKTVIFKKDPDLQRHCCERRHPALCKGKQLKINVKKNVNETGTSGMKCIQMLNKEVKENEEDGDHDGVMAMIGTTETIRRQFKRAAKPTITQRCMPADIDEDLQKSSFSNGSNVVRLNDHDFVFLMEDKGIEILRKAKYWKFDGTYEKKPKEYNQVYTIVAVFCEYPNWHKSYTTGIVFVKSKDTASYEMN